MHFIPLKKEPSNYSKYSVFASSAFLHLFLNLDSVSFVEGGRKNIPCLRTQGTLATPLPVPAPVPSKISTPVPAPTLLKNANSFRSRLLYSGSCTPEWAWAGSGSEPDFNLFWPDRTRAGLGFSAGPDRSRIVMSIGSVS